MKSLSSLIQLHLFGPFVVTKYFIIVVLLTVTAFNLPWEVSLCLDEMGMIWNTFKVTLDLLNARILIGQNKECRFFYSSCTQPFSFRWPQKIINLFMQSSHLQAFSMSRL